MPLWVHAPGRGPLVGRVWAECGRARPVADSKWRQFQTPPPLENMELRLVEPCRHRPIAHIAAEAGVSRVCLSKWKARCEIEDLAGLDVVPRDVV